MTVEEEINVTEQQLHSYEDLDIDQEDDDAYVARGNGFCNRKYSKEFIWMRIEQLKQQINELKKKLNT